MPTEQTNDMPDLGTAVGTGDSWKTLKNLTQARIALGRTGSALPTQAVLEFQLDHARARDAVGLACDFSGLEAWAVHQKLGVAKVSSQAQSRDEYLRRPDLGRQLDQESTEYLSCIGRAMEKVGLCIAVGDGLSSQAIERQTIPFLEAFLTRFPLCALPLGPLVLASQARVALGDEIGQAMGAQAVLMLVGERPGLSSPDSLGAYLTWAPKTGRQNSDRNCISNIRTGGLDHTEAARQAVVLIDSMFARQISGTTLKPDTVLC